MSEVPEWVRDHIRNVKFEPVGSQACAGYILDIFEDDKKADVQLYEPVEDGRHIITMELTDGIKAGSLERGIVYEFRFDVQKAPLSDKVVQFLKNEKNVEMSSIYQFVLRAVSPADLEN